MNKHSYATRSKGDSSPKRKQWKGLKRQHDRHRTLNQQEKEQESLICYESMDDGNNKRKAGNNRRNARKHASMNVKKSSTRHESDELYHTALSDFSDNEIEEDEVLETQPQNSNSPGISKYAHLRKKRNPFEESDQSSGEDSQRNSRFQQHPLPPPPPPPPTSPPSPTFPPTSPPPPSPPPKPTYPPPLTSPTLKPHLRKNLHKQSKNPSKLQPKSKPISRLSKSKSPKSTGKDHKIILQNIPVIPKEKWRDRNFLVDFIIQLFHPDSPKNTKGKKNNSSSSSSSSSSSKKTSKYSQYATQPIMIHEIHTNSPKIKPNFSLSKLRILRTWDMRRCARPQKSKSDFFKEEDGPLFLAYKNVFSIQVIDASDASASYSKSSTSTNLRTPTSGVHLETSSSSSSFDSTTTESSSPLLLPSVMTIFFYNEYAKYLSTILKPNMIISFQNIPPVCAYPYITSLLHNNNNNNNNNYDHPISLLEEKEEELMVEESSIPSPFVICVGDTSKLRYTEDSASYFRFDENLQIMIESNGMDKDKHLNKTWRMDRRTLESRGKDKFKLVEKVPLGTPSKQNEKKVQLNENVNNNRNEDGKFEVIVIDDDDELKEDDGDLEKSDNEPLQDKSQEEQPPKNNIPNITTSGAPRHETTTTTKTTTENSSTTLEENQYEYILSSIPDVYKIGNDEYHSLQNLRAQLESPPTDEAEPQLPHNRVAAHNIMTHHHFNRNKQPPWKNKKFNCFAVVLSCTPASITARGDWTMSVILTDDSLPLPPSIPVNVNCNSDGNTTNVNNTNGVAAADINRTTGYTNHIINTTDELEVLESSESNKICEPEPPPPNPSVQQNFDKITLNVFVKRRDMLPPVLRAGDALRCHRISIQEWNGDLQLCGHHYSSFVVVRQKQPLQHLPFDPLVTKDWEVMSPSKVFTYENMHASRFHELWYFGQNRLSMYPTFFGANNADHKCTLGELESDAVILETERAALEQNQNPHTIVKGDLTVMVTDIIPNIEQNPNSVKGFLRVWDGTGAAMTDVNPITGQPISHYELSDELLKSVSHTIKRFTQVQRTSPALPSPQYFCGKIVNVAIWETPHWDLITGIRNTNHCKRSGINIGDFVRLRNVKDGRFGHTLRGLMVHSKSSLTVLPNIAYEVQTLLRDHQGRIARNERCNPNSDVQPLDSTQNDDTIHEGSSVFHRIRTERLDLGDECDPLDICLGEEEPGLFSAIFKVEKTYPPFSVIDVADNEENILNGLKCFCTPAMHSLNEVHPHTSKRQIEKFHFRFCLTIYDDTADIEVIVCDDVAQKLLGVTADDVYFVQGNDGHDFQQKMEKRQKCKESLQKLLNGTWQGEIRSRFVDGMKYFELESCNLDIIE